MKKIIWYDLQVASPKNMKSRETNGGQQSGTSWAFELGSEQQICPIVIEDLERPGHMLIEVYFVDIYVCV